MDAYSQVLGDAPIEDSWIDKRTAPKAYGATLVEMKDVTDLYTWMCTPGKFTWRYPTTEVIVILSGHAILKPANREGDVYEIREGSAVVFQEGDVVHWEIIKPIQKIAIFPAVISKYLEPVNGVLTSMRAWKRRVAAYVRASLQRSSRGAPLGANRLSDVTHSGEPSTM
jgi:uncharacterized cupin superfamily protein